MDTLQNELNARDDLDLDIQIIGVNEVGYESGNASITSGRDLPWLQDTVEWNVWETWDPTYRDVIILGTDGAEVGRFNVTSNNLATSSNYDALLALFVDAATP